MRQSRVRVPEESPVQDNGNHVKDDRAGECRGNRSAAVKAAGFVCQDCYDDSEKETEEELHGEGEGQMSKVEG